MSTRDPFQETEPQYFISLGPEAYDPVLEHLREGSDPPRGPASARPRDRADVLEAGDRAMTLVRDIQRDKRPKSVKPKPSRAREFSDYYAAQAFGAWESPSL